MHDPLYIWRTPIWQPIRSFDAPAFFVLPMSFRRLA